jgi:hypothetical protein
MFNTQNKSGISAHPCIILYINTTGQAFKDNSYVQYTKCKINVFLQNQNAYKTGLWLRNHTQKTYFQVSTPLCCSCPDMILIMVAGGLLVQVHQQFVPQLPIGNL